MTEDELRQPSARLERARSILSGQGFKLVDGLTYQGRSCKAEILDQPTQEPPGLGARPSYVIRYFS